MKHTLKWFKNRIGKTIYRDSGSCKCCTCRSVVNSGLIVRDEEHAEYLEMVQHELEIDYRDKK